MKNSAKTRLRLFGLGEQVAPEAPTEPTNTNTNTNTQPTESDATTPAEAHFSPEEYAQIWHNLVREAEGKDFFSGKIITCHPHFRSILTATLIIYRARSGPSVGKICDIVPVWWDLECHPSEPADTPVLLDWDFSFADLRSQFLNQH